MALQKTYALRCDVCGRWSTMAGFSTSKLARAHASREGWTRAPNSKGDGLHDRCPRHQADA